MKKRYALILLPFLAFISHAQVGPPPLSSPIPSQSLPKLTYVEPALAHSYNWWRRVNPANITYFPSLGISDLNNHDTSLATYKAKTVLSFQGIEDASILPSLANDSMFYLEPLISLQQLLLRSTINDVGMQHLLPLKNLTHLECMNAGPFYPMRPDYRALTNNSMDVVATLTNLEVLKLYYCKWVTDAGLAKLANLVNLRELDLTAWNITDKGLSSLQGLTKLQILNLSFTGISDKGINYLAAFTQLESLDLSNTSISDTGINTLITMLPRMRSLAKLNLSGNPSISQKTRSRLADQYPQITITQ
jgi:Leucine-rich repeat (LRR) protein